MEYIWAVFLQLHSARSSNGYSANPIPYSEIVAWCALTRVRLAPWEIATLRSVDLAFLRVANEPKKDGAD